jgi:hypothetical protein
VTSRRGSTAPLDALLERAHNGERGAPLVALIEDQLATAALEALKLDMARRRMASRIDALTGGALDEAAVTELRELVAQRAQLERDAKALRARVADLREVFAELGGTRLVG